MIKTLFEELHKRDVKSSGDFSLINWSNADYPGFLADSSRYKVLDDYARWKKFRVFFHGQIIELNTQFNPDSLRK